MKCKNIISAALALSLVAGAIPAQAASLSAPGTVQSEVTLDTSGLAPEIFEVAVPSEIPLHMDTDGKLTIANNLAIENHSSKAVQVTGISVDGKNGWTIVDFSDDFSSKPVGSKDLALSFRSDSTKAGGNIDLTDGNWNIEKDASLAIEADIRLARQDQSSKVNIATINWTFDWAEKDDTDKSHVEITVLPGDHGRAEVTSLKPNEAGLVEDYPLAAADTGYEFTNWVDAETELPVDENTVYETNSSIKPVFALKSGWTRFPVPDTENVTFIPEQNPEILVDPNGTVQVVPEVVPNPGYVADGFEDGNGNAVMPGAEINININITITVIVRPENTNPEDPDKTVTLPILPGEHGNANADEVTTDKDGKIPAFPSVTPDEGYIFDHWEDENGNPVDKDTVFEKPTGIKPVCVPDPDYKPDMTTDVGILPGDHGAANTDKVTTDSDGKIPAFPSVTPDEGYEHVGWEKPDGSPVDENTVFGSGESIRPTFEKKANPIVNILPGDHGSANVGSVQTDDSHKIPEFPAVTPNEGYEHAGWEKPDGTPVNGETVFKEGDSIRPVFVKIVTKYSVTVIDSEHGIVEDKTVEIGSDNTILSLPDATPEPGYEFSKYVDEDGNTVSVGDILTGDKTIHPVYDQKPLQDFIITASNRTEVGYTGAAGEVLNIPSEFIGSDGNRYQPIKIDNNAFKGCANLKSVVVPSGVTHIGNMAFQSCSGLTSITMPNTLKSIGQQAFYRSALANVSIPNSVTSIGDFAFAYTSSLRSANIPNKLTTTANSMFMNSGLASITIPSSIKTINDYTFADCSNLTNITIPSNVTKIGYSAFSRTGLTSVTVPNSVTSLGEYCFDHNGNLRSVSIGSGVTELPACIFASCSALTSVSLSSSLRTIRHDAFANCTSMNPLRIPSSVTTIENAAFTAVPQVNYSGSASGSPWNANKVVR